MDRRTQPPDVVEVTSRLVGERSDAVAEGGASPALLGKFPPANPGQETGISSAIAVRASVGPVAGGAAGAAALVLGRAGGFFSRFRLRGAHRARLAPASLYLRPSLLHSAMVCTTLERRRRSPSPWPCRAAGVSPAPASLAEAASAAACASFTAASSASSSAMPAATLWSAPTAGMSRAAGATASVASVSATDPGGGENGAAGSSGSARAEKRLARSSGC